jgi:hypothetical protein
VDPQTQAIPASKLLGSSFRCANTSSVHHPVVSTDSRRSGEIGNRKSTMRLLVMSDLHANWPALEAVLGAESYDALLIGGDLVTYGPHPCEVVAFVERHASLVVRGLSR